jgi:hypothetical protein
MKAHLLSAADLTHTDALLVLDTAEELARLADRPIKKLPTLRGRTVVNLFFEDSTRTRISFEAAAKRLSADVINFSAKGSSVSKGESLKDTALTLEAMGADAVDLGQPHLDLLRARGRHVLADEVRADGQLAVAAVDQHRELDPGRAAEVAEGVQGGPDGPAGVQDVVYQDDGASLDAFGREVGALQRAGRVQPQVVAVHGHVQRADRDVGALDRGDPGCQPVGQRDPAGGDAQQHQVVGALGAFQDLVGDPGQGPADVGGLEHPAYDTGAQRVRGGG